MKSIVLLSGGMDSTTALYHAISLNKDIVSCVAFDYESKHNKKEHECAKKTCDKLGIQFHIIKLDFSLFKSDLLRSGGEIPEGHYADESMKRTVVPFRNGIMLSYSAGIAESLGANEIIIGNHTGDHAIYPDCTSEFIFNMNKAINRGTELEINISSPFGDINKTEIARIGNKLNVDWSLTWSCYKGKDIHCGKCGTCFERKEAFKESGVYDPTNYED